MDNGDLIRIQKRNQNFIIELTETQSVFISEEMKIVIEVSKSDKDWQLFSLSPEEVIRLSEVLNEYLEAKNE